MQDKEFLEAIVKELVDHPESVIVERRIDEMGVLLTLDVHPDDMGKVIGRSGATAKAIRSLLRVVGLKHSSRINLKINEPEGSTRVVHTHNEPTMPKAADMKDVDAAIEELKNSL